jgi:hypothetical protein
MAATPIEQLKREALAGLGRLDATLANMPPLLDAKPKRRPETSKEGKTL